MWRRHYPNLWHDQFVQPTEVCLGKERGICHRLSQVAQQVLAGAQLHRDLERSWSQANPDFRFEKAPSEHAGRYLEVGALISLPITLIKNAKLKSSKPCRSDMVCLFSARAVRAGETAGRRTQTESSQRPSVNQPARIPTDTHTSQRYATGPHSRAASAYDT